MICGSSANVSEKPCGYIPLKGDPKLAWMTIERHQKMKESYQSDGSMNQFLLDKHMYYLFWVGLFSGRIIHRKKWLDELVTAAARSFHKFATVSQRWNVWPEPFSTKIWCMLNTQAILPFNIDASVRKKSRTQFSLGSSRSPFRSVEKPTGLDAFAGAGRHDADSLWTLQEGPPVTGGHRELGSLEMEGSRSSGESQIWDFPASRVWWNWRVPSEIGEHLEHLETCCCIHWKDTSLSHEKWKRVCLNMETYKF